MELKEGDVVAIILPNLPESPISFLGVLEAGLVVTTVNPIYTVGMYLSYYKIHKKPENINNYLYLAGIIFLSDA